MVTRKVSEPVQDALKAYFELALGLTEASRKKAEKAVKKVAKELVGKGNATAAQIQGAVEDLVSTSAANREAVTRLVRVELDRAVSRMGLASNEDVAVLKSRIEALEGELRDRKAADGVRLPSSMVEAPAKKAAAGKKAVVAKKAVVTKKAPVVKTSPTVKAAEVPVAKKAADTTVAKKAPGAKKAADVPVAENAVKKAADVPVAEKAAKKAADVPVAEKAAKKAADVPVAEKAAKKAADVPVAKKAAKKAVSTTEATP